MPWFFWLLVLIVALAQVGVVLWVRWALLEIRRYQQGWEGLAETQLTHEFSIRYLRELVNPMARSGRAPLPKHLKQENPL